MTKLSLLLVVSSAIFLAGCNKDESAGQVSIDAVDKVYTATYSDYDPVIPTDMVACAGAVTSKRTVTGCTDEMGNPAAMFLCVDAVAEVVTKSPAGTEEVLLDNGVKTLACAEGETTVDTTYQCNAGYFLDGEDCLEVGIGFYSDITNNTRIECPANSSTLESTASSIASCLALPGYYLSSVGVVEEVGLGYVAVGDGVGRVACGAGEYSPVPTGTSCIECTAPPFSTAHEFDSSDSALSSDSCGLTSLTCAAGFESYAWACHAISYQATFTEPANTLVACAGSSTVPQVLSACTKNYADQSVAVDGSFCSSIAVPDTTLQSPAGTQIDTLTNGIRERTCAVGSSTPSSTIYTCNPGHYESGGDCVEVGVGYFSFSGARVACPVNSTTTGSTSTSIDDCLANAGYYKNGSTFAEVGPGYYSIAMDNDRHACGSGTYASGHANTACAACTNVGANMTAVTYSTTDSALGTNSCEFASVTCDSGYAKDPASMTCHEETFAATWTAPTNPGLTACGGSTTRSSTLATCQRTFMGSTTTVANSNCSDIAVPTTTFNSPSGTKNTAITNGTQHTACGVGQTTGTITRTCVTNYGDSGSACVHKCDLASPPVGQSCLDGTKTLGLIGGSRWKITPSGCTSGPTGCDGTTDDQVRSGDTYTNMCSLTAYGASNWNYPSMAVATVMLNNHASIGGFNTSYPYFTSNRPGGCGSYLEMRFSNGTTTGCSPATGIVRCVRSY